MVVESDHQARWPAYAMAVLFLGYAAGKAVFAAQGKLGFPSGPVVPPGEHERYAREVMDVATTQWSAAATGLLGATLVMATVTRVGRRVPRVLMLLMLAGAVVGVGAGATVLVVDGFIGLRVGWHWYHGVLGIVVVGLLVATIRSYARATRREQTDKPSRCDAEIDHPARTRIARHRHQPLSRRAIMTSPVLVTGGTGTLGGLVVPRLREAGRDVRVLSRHSHESGDGIEYVTVDLLGGEGIEPAVDGVETILHLAGGPNAKGDDEATRNLVRAASRAGVRHLVYISVIGADRVPLGYFKSKLAAERVVADSGLPWTTLRAAQVHDLVLTMLQAMAKLPVIPVPGGLRFQPVDASEVAARLAELTLGKPAGLVPDLAGPKVYPMPELIRGYLRARGKYRLLIPVRMPGKAGRAYRAGENLSLEGATVGKRTWEDFLAERVAHIQP